MTSDAQCIAQPPDQFNSRCATNINKVHASNLKLGL